MANLQAASFSASGEAKGKVDLPEVIFGGNGSRRVLHEAIVALRRNKRSGTSSTKTRGVVSGGGRKPWKQKGTGNARAGSIRSPLWRKGGIIFGPLPRSYRVNLNSAKKLLALQTALVEKARSSELSVIESVSFKEGKTAKAEDLFAKTGLTGRTLLVVDKKDGMVERAMRNLSSLTLLPASSLNAWGVLQAKQVIFTQAGLDSLLERFPKG
jgi:large subunit ribosomal protein L4